MLVLAYCAGLRLGEIARLRIGDVRLDQGVIEIRETKFGSEQESVKASDFRGFRDRDAIG